MLNIHDDSITAIDYIFEMASINDKYVHKLIYLIVSQVTEEKDGKVIYKNASHQIKSQIVKS